MMCSCTSSQWLSVRMKDLWQTFVQSLLFSHVVCQEHTVHTPPKKLNFKKFLTHSLRQIMKSPNACMYSIISFVVCTSNQFACSNGECIASNKRCDGNLDCMDGSDEPKNCCKLLLLFFNFFHCYFFFFLFRSVSFICYKEVKAHIHADCINECLVLEFVSDWIDIFYCTTHELKTSHK